MSDKARKVTQIVFLGFFLGLLVLDKIQVWMIVFIGSVIATIFFNRFYCGWICPIHTMMEAVTWIRRKLKLHCLPVGNRWKKPFIRYLILGLFFITFALVMFTGKKLPVLPVLFATGIVLTIFFSENLWHRYLCPYGTILWIVSAKANRYLKIDGAKCSGCSLCARICPGEAVTNHLKFSIDKTACLVCLKCQTQCPREAVNFN